jgi:hypothetical protein
MSDQEKRRSETLDRVLQKMIVEGVKFFVDADEEPCVELPKDIRRKVWTLDHKRVQVFVSLLFKEITNRFLKRSERALLLDLLAAECFASGRRVTEAAEKFEHDALVQSIIAFCNLKLQEQEEQATRQAAQKAPSLHNPDAGAADVTAEASAADKEFLFDGLTADLLKELLSDRIQGQITRDANFPKLTNLLSRAVNRRKAFLQGLGIEIDVKHVETGSWTTIKVVPPFVGEPDAVPPSATEDPSGKNSKEGRDLPAA